MGVCVWFVRQSTEKVLKHGTQAQTGYISDICLGLAKAGDEPANLALAREQAALALSA